MTQLELLELSRHIFVWGALQVDVTHATSCALASKSVGVPTVTLHRAVVNCFSFKWFQLRF